MGVVPNVRGQFMPTDEVLELLLVLSAAQDAWKSFEGGAAKPAASAKVALKKIGS